MKKSCWRKVVNQKGNEWWQIGKNKNNPLYLPEKWIHLREETPYGKKEFGYSYEVRADKRINKETIYGQSKFFKSKSSATNFVNKYMKENNKC